MKEKTHKTSIGGQAVMEGVMMRGPKEIAIAVRKPDDEIIIEKKPILSALHKNILSEQETFIKLINEVINNE